MLICWYKANYRPLPWREISNPYNIWLSEIILQQTRVAQGLPYYLKFVENYPTIFDLAAANEQDVLRLWQGLGYYSRARNLMKCAQILVNEHNGRFPSTYKELLLLPGIGKYTAAAIASFSFKERVAVVDGNVYRTLSRIFGINKDISSNDAHEYFKNFSEKLISAREPDIYNQAIMEFGATVCTPKAPKCGICDMSIFCYAFEHNKQAQFPVKTKKIKVTNRKFFYVVFYNDDGCLMKKRGPKDIWAEMYDFLWLDTSSLEDFDSTIEMKSLNNIIAEPSEVYLSAPVKHILSHQRLETSFVKVKSEILPSIETISDQELRFYTWEAVAKLPKPVLVDNFLKKMKFIN